MREFVNFRLPAGLVLLLTPGMFECGKRPGMRGGGVVPASILSTGSTLRGDCTRGPVSGPRRSHSSRGIWADVMQAFKLELRIRRSGLSFELGADLAVGRAAARPSTRRWLRVAGPRA